MNDFLNRLNAYRQELAPQGAWEEWLHTYRTAGDHLWDTSGSPSVSESVRAFLRMIPRQSFQTGYVLAAPANPNDSGRQSIPGVVRTDAHFVETVTDAIPNWKRDGTPIAFVRIDRSYIMEGYTMGERFIVLADGRLAGSLWYSIDELYEGMAQFIVKNEL